VDQPKPGHAFPCDTVAGSAGSERCAHSEIVRALRPSRFQDVPPLLREGACTPTEGTESEEPQAGCVFEDEPLQSSPSSTRLEHPHVIDACAWALERPTAAYQPRLSLQRPLREERTPSGEPGCLPSSGSFERRRSLLESANGRPPSHGTLPFGSPYGFASRGSTCAFVTFPGKPTRERWLFPLAGTVDALDGIVGGERLDRGGRDTGVSLPRGPDRSVLTTSTTEEPRG